MGERRMASFSDVTLRSLQCFKNELALNLILEAGQSFRWHKNQCNEWIGIFASRIWKLFQDDHNLYYKAIPTSSDPVVEEGLLKDYFQLDVNLQVLYEQWSKGDSRFADIAVHYPGIRVLRQDPVECLFSFLCSSNNNITRISNMVNRMCVLYGREIATIDGQQYCDFPSIESLAGDDVQQTLRNHKFGYRAAYVHRTAQLFTQTGRGKNWLVNLRNVPYQEAHSALVEFPGVGHKVADCVCLMALDKPSVVPIDTHIFKVVSTSYLPSLQGRKSLGDKVYRKIGAFFEERFGPYAGWAQSVLFTSDLSKFQPTVSKRHSRSGGCAEILKQRKTH